MVLRFGLLGTGYWAQEAHAAALAVEDEAEFVGVWGRDPAKAETVAKRFAVRAFADLDDLLAAVDAITVAVPPDVQARLAVRAAGAGRHLLLDKPVALTLADAQQVVDAAERGGVASVVFFTARFRAEVAAWIDELQRLGDWHGGHGMFLSSVLASDSPFGQSPWRQRKGALWDLGPHILALAIPALGPVERVTAAPGHGDTVHLVLGHQGGASSTLSVSQTVPLIAGDMSFSVYGPHGRMVMPSSGSSSVEAFRKAIRQLVATVDAGTTAHPCDARFGRDVVAVLERAEQSLAAADGA
jgi:predicted dehydrogenase